MPTCLQKRRETDFESAKFLLRQNKENKFDILVNSYFWKFGP